MLYNPYRDAYNPLRCHVYEPGLIFWLYYTYYSCGSPDRRMFDSAGLSLAKFIYPLDTKSIERRAYNQKRTPIECQVVRKMSIVQEK